MSLTRPWFSLGAGLLLCSVSALAQINLATLEGTITDSTDRVVPNTHLKITALVTGQSQEKDTNSAGHYRFPGLQVGTYTVTVSDAGFRTEVIKDVELQVGETHTLDVRLTVGAITDQVEVQASVDPVERSSAESGNVIRRDQIDSLPVNGRAWIQLTMLAPFAQDDGGGDQRTIRFAGRGRDDNNFTMDGIDASGIEEQTHRASVRLQVSGDAIEEYRVSSALYTAEYGFQAGGQINVVTRSGSNAFHGSAFGYLRNSVFDARSFLDPSTIPPFRLGQFGGTLGGPIVKNRTFFFLDYEGLRQVQTRTMQAFVPSTILVKDVLMNGRSGAGPSPDMCPILQSFAWRASAGTIGGCAPRFAFPDALFTAQTGGSGPEQYDVDAFTHQGNTTGQEDSWLVRIDHRLSDTTTLFVRAQRDIAVADTPLGNLFDRQKNLTNPANYVVAVDHVFSSSILNEAKFGVNRNPFQNPVLPVFPLAISTSNFEGLNLSTSDLQFGTTYSWIDNLTITRGNHTLKAGIEFRRILLNQGHTAGNSISFPDDLSLVSAAAVNISYTGSWYPHAYRRNLVLPFVQDEWKLTPTLTVNLGLRFDYYGVPTEAHNRTFVFDLERCHGRCPAGSPLYFSNPPYLDPRVSIAWAPRSLHGQTVVRSGFGIYHGVGQNDDVNAALESDSSRVQLSGPLTYSTGFLQNPPDFGVGTVALRSPRAAQRDRKDLYVEQWGLTIDHALPSNLLFTASYLGSHGVHLFTRSSVDLCVTPPDPATGNCPRALDAYPFGTDPATGQPLTYGSVDIKSNTGTSNYNALLLSLQRRLTSGLSLQASYTWSHAINDGSVGGGESFDLQNVNCQKCDIGPSVFDIRQNFIANGVYELPFGPGKPLLNKGGLLSKITGGWSLSGIDTFRTGHPLTVLFNVPPNLLPDGNDVAGTYRPDLVAGVPVTLPGGGKNGQSLINPAAFVAPPHDPVTGLTYRYGNEGRGLVRSPNYWQTDISLSKETKLTERISLEFQVHAFNAFNHTPLGDPTNLTLGYVNTDQNGNTVPYHLQASPDFGVINRTVNYNSNNIDGFAAPNTGTGLPRQLQFVMRVKF